jgi:hypothetical protein
LHYYGQLRELDLLTWWTSTDDEVWDGFVTWWWYGYCYGDGKVLNLAQSARLASSDSSTMGSTFWNVGFEA